MRGCEYKGWKEREKLCLYTFLVYWYVFRSVCVKRVKKVFFMNFKGKMMFFWR